MKKVLCAMQYSSAPKIHDKARIKNMIYAKKRGRKEEGSNFFIKYGLTVLYVQRPKFLKNVCRNFVPPYFFLKVNMNKKMNSLFEN